MRCGVALAISRQVRGCTDAWKDPWCKKCRDYYRPMGRNVACPCKVSRATPSVAKGGDALAISRQVRGCTDAWKDPWCKKCRDCYRPMGRNVACPCKVSRATPSVAKGGDALAISRQARGCTDAWKDPWCKKCRDYYRPMGRNVACPCKVSRATPYAAKGGVALAISRQVRGCTDAWKDPWCKKCRDYYRPMGRNVACPCQASRATPYAAKGGVALAMVTIRLALTDVSIDRGARKLR